MKRSFKNRIEFLGLSYNKEIFILVVLNLLVTGFILVASYLLKEKLILLGVPFGIGLITYLFISRYKTLEEKENKEHEDEFISLLSYFEIFISNGNNVYNSFKMLLPYASIYLEDLITSFLNQIDEDKSVQPFTHFASKFNNRIIESLMLSIYQMVDSGGSDRQFEEFNILFSSVARDYHASLIENKKKKLDTMNSFPLFGAGGIVISLTLCILSIVGDMSNVL